MSNEVEFDTNNGRIMGTLLRMNAKTVVVRLESGKIIKRHKRKHAVTP